MNYLTLFRAYVVWHYSRAIVDILGLMRNYLWFVNHLFSVPDIAKTLFAPLKRLQEKKVNFIAKPEQFFGNLLINLLMRIIGLCLRSVLLLMAFAGFLFVLIFGLGFLIFWLFLPIVLVFVFVTSIQFLFA